MARPVYDPAGRMIAAIGISGPTVRIDDARLVELGAIVCASKDEREGNSA